MYKSSPNFSKRLCKIRGDPEKLPFQPSSQGTQSFSQSTTHKISHSLLLNKTTQTENQSISLNNNKGRVTGNQIQMKWRSGYPILVPKMKLRSRKCEEIPIHQERGQKGEVVDCENETFGWVL